MERSERNVEDEIARVDVAYLDGTFYSDGELPGRNMRDIPHPFVIESIERFANLPAEQRNKVRLIHFNHTNPLLDLDSAAAHHTLHSGLRIAQQMERVEL